MSDYLYTHPYVRRGRECGTCQGVRLSTCASIIIRSNRWSQASVTRSYHTAVHSPQPKKEKDKKEEEEEEDFHASRLEFTCRENFD